MTLPTRAGSGHGDGIPGFHLITGQHGQGDAPVFAGYRGDAGEDTVPGGRVHGCIVRPCCAGQGDPPQATLDPVVGTQPGDDLLPHVAPLVKSQRVLLPQLQGVPLRAQFAAALRQARLHPQRFPALRIRHHQATTAFPRRQQLAAKPLAAGVGSQDEPAACGGQPGQLNQGQPVVLPRDRPVAEEGPRWQGWRGSESGRRQHIGSGRSVQLQQTTKVRVFTDLNVLEDDIAAQHVHRLRAGAGAADDMQGLCAAQHLETLHHSPLACHQQRRTRLARGQRLDVGGGDPVQEGRAGVAGKGETAAVGSIQQHGSMMAGLVGVPGGRAGGECHSQSPVTNSGVMRRGRIPCSCPRRRNRRIASLPSLP